jgi:hypothetical protein
VVTGRRVQALAQFGVAFVVGTVIQRYVLNAGVARSLVLGAAVAVGAAVGWYFVVDAEPDA